jgi:chromatin modification-related protein EAF6
VDEGEFAIVARDNMLANAQPDTDDFSKAQEGTDSNTPSHAATPTGSVPASLSRAESTSGATGKTGGNKKKRATDKDDDDEKAPKRGKITYSRE